jgi:hypothetical protein
VAKARGTELATQPLPVNSKTCLLGPQHLVHFLLLLLQLLLWWLGLRQLLLLLLHL